MSGHFVFENDNGSSYFIVAGNDKKALLRDLRSGSFVIAWNLDWIQMCWGNGSYFAADDFEEAVKAFLRKEG